MEKEDVEQLQELLRRYMSENALDGKELEAFELVEQAMSDELSYLER